MATHRPLAGRRLSPRMVEALHCIARQLTARTYLSPEPATHWIPSVAGGLRLIDEQGRPAFHPVEAVEWVAYPVNHFRRMKSAWATHGIDGLNHYLLSMGVSTPFPPA